MTAPDEINKLSYFGKVCVLYTDHQSALADRDATIARLQARLNAGPNEITAEELAREMRKIKGLDDPRRIDFITAAETFMLATHAHAALMADRRKDDDLDFRLPKFVTELSTKLEARDRVRCWYLPGHGLFTVDWETAESWRDGGDTPVLGWFTPDTGDAG